MNDEAPVSYQPYLLLSLAGLTWAWAWLKLLVKVHRGQPILEHEPGCSRPWGLADVVVAFAILSTSQAFAGISVAYARGIKSLTDAPPEEQAMLLGAVSLATVLAFFAALAWLRFRYGPISTALGFVRPLKGSDVHLGLATFLLLAPVVYGIQSILVRWSDTAHPLIELLKDDPSPRFFAVGIFSAVVVAPVVEEFLFRGLLQGWLERIATRRSVDSQIVWGGSELSAEAATQGGGFASHTMGDDSATPQWPVWVSATIFALVHISHGLAWIPLLAFGGGLGYLFHRTHRLLPCIVLHFALNACSMLGLIVWTFSQ